MFGTSGFLLNTGKSRLKFPASQSFTFRATTASAAILQASSNFSRRHHDARCARTESERFFAESAGRRQRLSAGSGRGPFRLLARLLGELLHWSSRAAEGDVLQAGRHALP